MEKPAATEYPLQDLIRRRWSPLAFSDRAVEPEKLHTLLEAARWSASSYNEQPWAFLVATKDHPEEFDKMLYCLEPGNLPWASKAPVLMISLARLQFEKNGKPNRHAYHDVGMATQNLTLQATSMGLWVHAMAGFKADKVRQEYEVPETYDPVAAIAVGYAAADSSGLPDDYRKRHDGPRARKPAETFVFRGRFGSHA